MTLKELQDHTKKRGTQLAQQSAQLEKTKPHWLKYPAQGQPAIQPLPGA